MAELWCYQQTVSPSFEGVLLWNPRLTGLERQLAADVVAEKDGNVWVI